MKALEAFDEAERIAREAMASETLSREEAREIVKAAIAQMERVIAFLEKNTH